MAVSFITRFRRRIATIPYVIVVVVPVLLVALYFTHRGRVGEEGIRPAETQCVAASDALERLAPCPELQRGATD